MTYQDFLDQKDKYIIYINYRRIITNCKQYEKITKKQMIEEIINTYKQPNKIYDICDDNELYLLSKIIKKKLKHKKRINKKINAELESLQEKYILIEDKKKQVIFVPDEIKASVKEAIKQLKKQSKERIDKINHILRYILNFYGILEEKQLYECLNSYIKVETDLFKNIHDTNSYFHFYAFSIKDNKKIFWINENYRSIVNDLIDNYNFYKKTEYKKVSLEELATAFQNPFYKVSDDLISKLELIIEKYNLSINYIIEELFKCAIGAYEITEIEKYIKKTIKQIPQDELNYIKKILYSILDNMPSIALKGFTPIEFQETINQNMLKKQYEKAYKNLENKEEIEDYQQLRKQTDELIGKCAMLISQKYNNILEKYLDVSKKYNIEVNSSLGNILDNLIIFHSLVDSEKTPFSLFVQNELNILSSDYSIAWQMEDNLIESIFQIKELVPLKGMVKLLDLKTDIEYTIFDISLSSSNKFILDNYIFTTLLTVNHITFANGYAFLFEKKKHPTITEDIEIMKENIEDITNEKTKEFIAYYLLFLQDKKEENQLH